MKLTAPTSSLSSAGIPDASSPTLSTLQPPLPLALPLVSLQKQITINLLPLSFSKLNVLWLPFRSASRQIVDFLRRVASGLEIWSFPQLRHYFTYRSALRYARKILTVNRNIERDIRRLNLVPPRGSSLEPTLRRCVQRDEERESIGR